MSALILDLPLARRVEFAEARAAADGAEASKQTQPDSGAAVERIAGGYAVFFGVVSPLTQAVGVGLDGPVESAELDRLEEFFSSRGDATRVELCPLADGSVLSEFGKRGYRVTEFSNVMARTVEATESWPPPPVGVTIERLHPDQTDLWTQTVAQGFAEQFPVTPELIEVMRMFARGRNSICFLARCGGEVAGGACVSVRDGIAGLFGASTLPAFRRRGIQTALVQARLALAAASGCDLAVSIAVPGSASQRNILRHDFQTLYTRVKFEKEFLPRGGAEI